MSLKGELMNSRMLPVRSAMSSSTGMVSLRPLLRFSSALGRQVFPVDGSGGQQEKAQSPAVNLGQEQDPWHLRCLLPA